MQRTFELTEPVLRGLYRTATDTDKKFLEDKFGKQAFTQNIMDRIKTWEDAAAEVGMHPVKNLPYPNAVSNRQKAVNAFFMCDVIVDVLLDGVVLDWTDSDQKKWYAWFNEYTPGSGFRFFAASCDWSNTNPDGGARLCLDTKEKAVYFGTQFLPIINQFLNPIK